MRACQAQRLRHCARKERHAGDWLSQRVLRHAMHAPVDAHRQQVQARVLLAREKESAGRAIEERPE